MGDICIPQQLLYALSMQPCMMLPRCTWASTSIGTLPSVHPVNELQYLCSHLAYLLGHPSFCEPPLPPYPHNYIARIISSTTSMNLCCMQTEALFLGLTIAFGQAYAVMQDVATNADMRIWLSAHHPILRVSSCIASNETRQTYFMLFDVKDVTGMESPCYLYKNPFWAFTANSRVFA